MGSRVGNIPSPTWPHQPGGAPVAQMGQLARARYFRGCAPARHPGQCRFSAIGAGAHRGQAAARTLGLEVATLEIRRADEIAPAFGALKGGPDALYVVVDALISSNRTRILTLR